jgi:hypothetical protein
MQNVIALLVGFCFLFVGAWVRTKTLVIGA